jgi:hypothetical protein
MFVATSYAVVFTALSLPVGLKNSSISASIIVALLYLPLALLAAVKCWRTSPFHPVPIAAAMPPALLLLFAAMQRMLHL